MSTAKLRTGKHFQEVYEDKYGLLASIWTDRVIIKPESYLGYGYQIGLFFNEHIVGWFHVDTATLDDVEIAPERRPAIGVEATEDEWEGHPVLDRRA
jgi:hypothetical protein